LRSPSFNTLVNFTNSLVSSSVDNNLLSEDN
jgi:hypothetical protein